MKARDLIIILTAAVIVTTVIFLLAGDVQTSEFCERLLAGLAIGSSVLVAIWGYTRLGTRH